MIAICNATLTVEDWFDRGKSDAWSGHSKQAPDHDALAASLYDLGFNEGTIERPRSQYIDRARSHKTLS
jgi:hypothetical protein